MKAQRTFSEALCLLDQGAAREAEFKLRQAISFAEAEGDELVLGSALCRLGEFLVLDSRGTEGRAFLNRILSIDREDDALFSESDRARELLGVQSASI